MKDFIDGKPGSDDIDTIVDTLLNDPSRADDVKSILRDRLAQTEGKSASSDNLLDNQSDADEFWDNFPI